MNVNDPEAMDLVNASSKDRAFVQGWTLHHNTVNCITQAHIPHPQLATRLSYAYHDRPRATAV